MLDAFLIYLPKNFQQNSMCIVSFSEHVKLQDHNAVGEVSKKKQIFVQDINCPKFLDFITVKNKYFWGHAEQPTLLCQFPLFTERPCIICLTC